MASVLDTLKWIYAEVLRVSRKLDGIRGPGVTHTPTGITIAPPPGRTAAAGEPQDDAFYARVSANSRDGSNYRWSYSFVEVLKTSAGYGGWGDLTGGRTGTLYNLIEDRNGVSGLMGNGVDTANLPAGFSLKPIPTGTRVRVLVVAVPDTDPEYWVSYANGVDGTCS